MRPILDFGFWILDLRGALLLAGALCVAGCGGMPSFPEPEPGYGQIVVDLKGEPREGVGGPARETVMDGYTIRSESVEKGKAFERVDYEEIEDVVVIARRKGDGDAASPLNMPVAPVLVVNDDGFEQQQLVALFRMESPTGLESAGLAVRNQTSSSVTVYGFAGDEGFEITVPAGRQGQVSISSTGEFDVYCEEIASAYCKLYVTGSEYNWIGPSDEYPFFDFLSPGQYTLRIHPPRLPVVTKTVTVTAGQRTIVTAELSVNDLPKAE